jgi:hypothetical protein
MQATLREAWLEQAVSFLLDHMESYQLARVSVRVSCGWPSRGGAGMGQKVVIGQCFDGLVCKDGKPQIFISPRIDSSIDVLGTLLHELLHASVGCTHGHKKPFSQAAKKVGLEGPPTATTVGKDLVPVLQRFVDTAGPYPHAAVVPTAKKKPGSRLRLYECACEQPFKVRIASDEFTARCLICDALFVQVKKDKEEEEEEEDA